MGKVKAATRLAARPDLVAPVATPDHIVHAHYISPSSLFIRFSDGLEGTWPFADLELGVSNLRRDTIKVSSDGTGLNATTTYGETVFIEATSFRAAIDPAYAAQLQKKFLNLRGPLENVTTNAKTLPLKKKRAVGRKGG